MKVAITAASGSLGSEIVRAVIPLVGSEGVVALARTPSNAQSLGIEVRPGDYESPGELERSLKGIDAVLLVSGMDAPDKRVEQHRNVISAAREAGVSKMVYTSIQGAESGTAFSPIVQSNRQTEDDVRSSGMRWSIGRNGIYIEPDVEYVDQYKMKGEIANCAGNAKCGYTTRPELAYAYAHMLTEEKHDHQTYNLHGETITQQQLANYLNSAFGTELKHRDMSVDAYRKERIDELGEVLGTVIAGIYEGIREGALDDESHFAIAAGRPHQTWQTYFKSLATTSRR